MIPLELNKSSTRYIDLDKAFAVLIRVFFKTITNVLLRHENEETEPLLKSVLEKSSRVDVAEDPSLLVPSEREILETWEKRSEKYNIAKVRIEQSLFTLRECRILVEAKT